MKIFRLILAITLLVNIWISTAGQSRWIISIYGEKDAYGSYFVETYDHGYLIVGKHGHTAVSHLWLIKTDINGGKLWEKTLSMNGYQININHLNQNSKGEIFLAGSTNRYDEYKDPIIIKLDSCGEKQWCKILSMPGSLNYAFHVLHTDIGGCVALLYSGEYPVQDRVSLACFNKDGDLLWNENYESADTSMWCPFGESFIRTNDKGYLITGDCYYENPNQPNLFQKKPYYIKTDSMGVFEWETVVYKDAGGEMKGSAWSTSINPSGTYYYSSIKNIYPDHYGPALLKMDLHGNVIDIYDVISGYKQGGLAYATFINDTVLAASAGWGNTDEDHVGYAILIDTNGNIVDSTFLVQDIYTKYMDTVYDNKLVYMYNTYKNDQFDVYLRKLNQQLEDDTMYSFPFQYDTLCPFPIASDTITIDDCGLIVSTVEWPPVKIMTETEDMLEVFPNPAYGEIHCKYRILERSGNPDLSGQNTELTISLYDIWGRLIESVKIPSGQSQIRIDVSDYTPGVYFVVLKEGEAVLGRKKVVVCD